MKCIALVTIFLISSTSFAFFGSNNVKPYVHINIEPYSIVYEGDIINCSISNAKIKYWKIENGSKHLTFHGNNVLLFDPEPTPLDKEYVNLTVYAENEYGVSFHTIPLKIKRIYFGDIHWHTVISDGQNDIDTMYQNAIKDNYLDFASCTDHAELIDGINTKFGGVPWWDFIKTIMDKIFGRSEWQLIKEKANEYYMPGKFTTLLAFEWTAAQWSMGGKKFSPNGWEDVGHINFYYRDVYPDAPEYSDLQKLNYDEIFKAMAEEWDKGHLNIAFPHHPQGKICWNFLGRKIPMSFTTNWSFLANGMKNKEARDKILRGGEVYSRWGNAIGQYYTPGIPWLWGYNEENFYNQTDAWMENALWEWSKLKGEKFVMIASSDTHEIDRPGSASREGNPSGLVAVYAVHNTRHEIWDALNECDAYALQLQKLRALAKFDGQIAYGRWINCSKPLKVQITAYSTFPGIDHGNKSMCPHGYSPDKLNYIITDIWLVKKDREKGKPWCKVIGHATPNKNIAVIDFQDNDVMPDDFYWIAIKQMNEEGEEYMAFLGPIFINNVI